jgi:outer membrane protein assembly factor BamB
LSQYESDNSNDDMVCEPEQEESKIPVLSPSATMVGGPKDTPWPMKCYDNHHTSQSPYSTAHIDGLEKWRFRCDWVEGGPVIDSDGTIYFGDFDYYLYALYPDGTFKWKYKTGGLIWSVPAIAEDGTIYACTFGNYLHAINPDGTEKWNFNAHDSIVSSPAIAEDGTIYFGTMGTGHRIYAVNPNGTEKWYYAAEDAVISDPAIGDDGTIYIGSFDDYLYAMNPNGTLKWRFKTGDYIKGPPSISDDGTIYVGSWDDYLYALWPNGTMRWKCRIGQGTETNPSIASDGTIYVGSYDGHLYAVNPNGTLKWSFSVKGNIHQSSPAISADGTIYFGTDDSGYIYAVSPNGTERWRKKIADKWVEASPSIAEDGTVYIGSSYDMGGGYLNAFGPQETNEPPETPTISGETIGKIGYKYRYSFSAVDPDNNPISYYIDWDDGTSGWVGTRASGELCYFSHTWATQGDYTIKAKVKDVFDEESGWATFEVKIERKSREVQQMLFYHLLEQFPLLQKILCYIL